MTASDNGAALNGGLIVFGAASLFRGVVELVVGNHRRARGDGRGCRVRDAGDALDPGPRVPAQRAAAGDRDLGGLRRGSAWPWAASSAARCSSTSGGGRSSSSTCSWWGSRWSPAPSSSRSTARRSTRRSTRSVRCCRSRGRARWSTGSSRRPTTGGCRRRPSARSRSPSRS